MLVRLFTGPLRAPAARAAPCATLGVLSLLCLLSGGCSTMSVVAASPHDDDPFRVEYSDVRVAGEFGQREYRDADWDQLQTPSVAGVTGSHEPPDWPVGVDMGVFYSWDSGRLNGARLELSSWEGFAGLMKSFTLIGDALILQAGAGGAVNYLEASPKDPLLANEDAYWTSLYARLGLTLQISPEFEFGFGVRSARSGDFNLVGAQLDGDYDQVVFTLSSSW